MCWWTLNNGCCGNIIIRQRYQAVMDYTDASGERPQSDLFHSLGRRNNSQCSGHQNLHSPIYMWQKILSKIKTSWVYSWCHKEYLTLDSRQWRIVHHVWHCGISVQFKSLCCCCRSNSNTAFKAPGIFVVLTNVKSRVCKYRASNDQVWFQTSYQTAVETLVQSTKCRCWP